MKDYDVIICVLKNDSYDSRELEERLYEVQKKMAEEADGKAVSEKASSVVMEKYLYWRM